MQSQSTMTMIAATEEPVERVLAYVGGNLVSSTEPIDDLYFITIPADETGMVTFALESGDEAQHVSTTLPCLADAHYGTLEQPVMLGTQTSSSATVTAYPTVFTDQVTFYVNGEMRNEKEEMSVTLTDALGRHVLQEEKSIFNSQFSIPNLKDLPAGVYFATVSYNDNVTTIKLIKK